MTTRDEAIAAAKEVGFCIAEAAYPYTVKPVASVEQLDRFYVIAHKAGMERAAEICKETSDAGAVQNCIAEIHKELSK